jgi:hypothetical protein
MSSSPFRMKRDVPERSGPVRNPLVSAISGTARAPQAEPGGLLRGALECGVRTAYSVIDEYMKRGYEAARQYRETSEDKGHMSNQRSNYGNWNNAWGPMTPLVDQWSAAMKFWMDAWSSFMPGGRGGWPMAGMPGMPGPAGFPGAAPAPEFSVEVASKRPTEVIVQIKPGAGAMELKADSFAPPLLDSVALHRDQGRLQVRVTVSDAQAAGRYQGVIRAADGSIAGEVTVVIAELPKASV